MQKRSQRQVIKRLPRYYRYLGELMEEKVERISSNDLSKKSACDCFTDPTGLK